MAAEWIEKITGSFEDKRRYRQYKARIKQLPTNYRTAVEGLERYLLYFGRGDGADAISMFEDLIDLFEQSAANETPIREIVGQDPVEFIEAFIQNYSEGQWRLRERQRLINAIERAAGEDTRKDDGSP
jgi:DNA-binding ferritin-like protein (Dps family)